MQHGDELVLLAAEMLRNVWTDLLKAGDDLGCVRCQLDSVLLLEYGRTCSPYNYQVWFEKIEEEENRKK